MTSESAGPTGVRLTDVQRLDWLQLIRTESIGPKTFRSLLNRFGGAGAALQALPELAKQRAKPIRIADRGECEREIEALHVLGAQLVSLGESDYPATLRAVDAAPPMISVRGSLEALRRPMVAIVGSRNASAAGLAFTERLSRDLAHAGFVIVSGLARGVDARAHRTTLAAGTVAVLAGGLDKIYPGEHRPLADDILARGAVVTEMPLGWEPRGRDFPRRNRIVSGLSLGTVVIEAARSSGSLITSRFAIEQGREVFAVPGSPLDPRAEGANGLLREGATLCTRAEDVIAALQPLIGKSFSEPGDIREDPPSAPSEPLWDEWDLAEATDVPQTSRFFEMDEPYRAAPAVYVGESAPDGDVLSRVTGLLSPAPVLVDDLVRTVGLSVAEVQGALLDLELDGRLERHGGGLVSLVGGA